MRAPFTLVVIASELSMVAASTGVSPSWIWRTLAAPAYAAHLVLFQVIPGGYFVYAAILVAVAVAADLILWRSGARARD